MEAISTVAVELAVAVEMAVTDDSYLGTIQWDFQSLECA